MLSATLLNAGLVFPAALPVKTVLVEVLVAVGEALAHRFAFARTAEGVTEVEAHHAGPVKQRHGELVDLVLVAANGDKMASSGNAVADTGKEGRVGGDGAAVVSQVRSIQLNIPHGALQAHDAAEACNGLAKLVVL